MIFLFRKRYIAVFLCLISAVSLIMSSPVGNSARVNTENEKKFIKWVDFTVPVGVLKKAIEFDIQSRNDDIKLNFIEILAYISAKIGSNYKNYKAKMLTELIKEMKDGKAVRDLASNLKYYPFYLEAYTAILEGYVGEYEVSQVSGDGISKTVLKYGLKVKQPLKGKYTDCDDFGAAREYGFSRKHLGHDFMSSVGANVVAMEEGMIEVMGWNQYGGWRIGIRSLDGKRYYYYAHLRKDNPFAADLKEGQTVKAGQLIGYVGKTGYSVKENVNNIKIPHLHFGIQIIFDASQKDGDNQIWIDCYQIAQLLKDPPAPVDVEF